MDCGRSATVGPDAPGDHGVALTWLVILGSAGYVLYLRFQLTA